MSNYLPKDHWRIQSIVSLFYPNTDFDLAEFVLFAAAELAKAALSMSDDGQTRTTTIHGTSTLALYGFKLANGDYKITEDNIELLNTDLSDWINERVGKGVFHEKPFSVYENFTEDQKKRFIENSDDSILRLFMNQGHIWKIREVDGEEELYPEKLIFQDQSAHFKEPFAEHVIRMSESDALDNATTKLIAEITRENYSFKQFKRDVAQKFNDSIQAHGREEVTSTINVGQKMVDFYIGLTLDGDSYTLSQSLYSGDQKEVPSDALSEAEVASFLMPNIQEFPASIMKNQDGETIPEIKEELENFEELIDTDVTDYKFKFMHDVSFSENILGFDITNDQTTSSWTKAIKKWLNDTKTIQAAVRGHVVSAYVSFLISMISDIEDGTLSDTIGDHYKNALEDKGLSTAQAYIMFEKVINAKKAFFDALSDATKETSQEGETITDEEREKAYKASIEAFKRGQGEEIPEDPISEEDLENRQKFFKQCALMLNMPSLKSSYSGKLRTRYKNKKPYDGRFLTAHSPAGEQETTLSSLVSSEKEQKLFELETHKVTKLVPKIRLFKVFHHPKKGEKQVEFIFNRSSNIRSTFMNDDSFDRGTGVGLKNFSFEFNGTSPATARNDITASLTLFFQSFKDFLKFRSNHTDPDLPYRYVDLIIQPTPDKDGMVGGTEIQANRQYEPQFYRIRADVGYVLPTTDDGFTQDEIDSIRVSNKSFFLNMVDHDIKFGKDGTVEITISYRAYLESLLKHPRLDALASPELIAKRQENAKTLLDELRKKECSIEQIKELQVSLAAQETVLVKQSLSSIIHRLRSRGVIYNVLVDQESTDFFLKNGYFQSCNFETSSESDGGDGVDVKLVLNSNLPESSDDFDFIDSGNRNIQFFYFGDLLYTILDCVYDSNNKIRSGCGFERNSILLTSFEFEPFQSKQTNSSVYNIADIPISVDFFSRWFVDNVVSQKSTRKTFPVLNFIRNLSNNLIKPTLIENCVNRKMENKLRFQTTQITTFEKGGKNPLLEHYGKDEGPSYPSIDVDLFRKINLLPFKGGPETDANSNFKDFHTMIVVSSLGSTLTFSGRGNYGDDIEKGRFHIHVGQNSGLVKTLSLSKSDQQYIREARFFQNGIDGLLQLSAVYVANIEMFGNAIFYPGMEIFFNPFGIGGPDFNPTEEGSDANKLGIGGYHTITSVKSSITPGKFTTSIQAQQYYSGDGSGNPNLVKMKEADENADGGKLEDYKPEHGDTGFASCKQVILDTQNYNFEEGSLFGQLNEVPASSPPIETARGDGGGSSSSSVEAEPLPTVEQLSDKYQKGPGKFQGRSGIFNFETNKRTGLEKLYFIPLDSDGNVDMNNKIRIYS